MQFQAYMGRIGNRKIAGAVQQAAGLHKEDTHQHNCDIPTE